MSQEQEENTIQEQENEQSVDVKTVRTDKNPVEVGGRGGLEPTRYGDWEKNGRCIDF